MRIPVTNFYTAQYSAWWKRTSRVAPDWCADGAQLFQDGAHAARSRAAVIFKRLI